MMNRKTYLCSNSILSPIGFGTEINFKSVISGKTALKTYHHLGNFDHTFCAGRLQEYSNLKSYTKLESMLIQVIKSILLQSNKKLSDKKTLLIIASTKGNIDLLGQMDENDQGVYLPELGKRIAEYFSCANHPIILSNACVSGLSALIMAQRLVASGQYDDVIVSAGDLVSEFVLSGFYSFNALSDEPCKPFDAQRKGINLGEAAAAQLISCQLPMDTSRVSELLPGFGTNDANHISGPSRTGEGLLRSIQKTCLEQNDISFISAHGTATPYNDEMEAIAFSRANLNHVPVHSLKGYYGHTLATSALLETILSNFSLHSNVLIQSNGFSELGVSVPLNVINKSVSMPLKSFLKTSSGFGGTNASILCKKV